MPNRVAPNPELPNIAASSALLERALKVIPCATQTLAKGPTMYVRGAAPNFLQRGEGATVYDVDGNAYLDMVMALGPVSLGYCYPAVDQAISRQLQQGIAFWDRWSEVTGVANNAKKVQKWGTSEKAL